MSGGGNFSGFPTEGVAASIIRRTASLDHKIRTRENDARAERRSARNARADRLSYLKRRPLWRKVYDGIVYVLTGREP